MTSEQALSPEQVLELAGEFREELVYPSRRGEKQVLIVIGGAPGSGKTTAAQAMAKLSGAWHVQANSARQVLRDHEYKWGENVHLLIREVVGQLLGQGSSVVLDGMLTEEKERQLLKDVAAENGVPVFFIAIKTDPAIGEGRARERYDDNKASTFEDWRASPDKKQEYYESIWTQADVLDQNLAEIPDNLGPGGVLRIGNEYEISDLQDAVRAAWGGIQRLLK